MDDIRTLIQSYLLQITNIDCGVPQPDDLIEDNQTYFGYMLSETYLDGDFDRNYSMQITLNGHLVRRNNDAENTLQIMDTALSELLSVLKQLNFKYSYEDVNIDSNIRKIHITGFVRYNEINNWLI